MQRKAEQFGSSCALYYRDTTLDYQTLWDACQAFAQGLRRTGLSAGARVACFLPKQPETVFTLFGTSAAGGVFVPVNPLLKPRQVVHILSDCNVQVLVTSAQRLKGLQDVLQQCPDLQLVVTVDAPLAASAAAGANASCTEHYRESLATKITGWPDFVDADAPIAAVAERIDADMAAILYTSGSTGHPKGVVLSHRNLLAGAESVASYLGNTASDRVLALLPLSFDAGLSQLTTMFFCGGSAVLMDYLLPGDVLRALERFEVTGLGAVPPIWNQLAGLEWPSAVVQRLRYITNTGGAMPTATTRSLAARLPHTQIFLMYGLTEAFRSTYLPPDQVALRPDSIGRAIPNAEILVVDANGRECAPDEPGELVHRGPLVAMGYWNAPELTARRFRPAPGRPPELSTPELAVWSGDRVRRDREGYLYFLSREDDMIKTSGYRVSPTEVEEVVYGAGNIAQAAAMGLAHPSLGQAILVLVSPVSNAGTGTDTEIDDSGHALQQAVLGHCRRELPSFMVPQAVIVLAELPLGPNGKLDRKWLASEYSHYFQE
ncbi:acyl-CoA ligase (AMP-forming), exosortase A system-associated [Parahaliea mediterranea]|uniref:acyl-CoA ligase (AMP-forming), exosortase A system-associated n=1 Tax=Parahaliea mediterranea TaxID=651086 RepID=UPI0019D44220|nr:acyl-CoA ligase (AMP-forming), exosortase A system-associated [Parahaliea mediterranea]